MLIPIIPFIVGLVLLIKGGDWFVDGAVGIAHRFRIPELLIGANLFNLVLVSGVSASLSPFDIPASKTIAGINSSLVLDIPVMLGVMALLTVPAIVKGRLYRWQGILLMCVYATFCVMQFVI